MGPQRVINLLVGLSAAAFALMLAAIAKFDLGLTSEEVRTDALGADCLLFGTVAGQELHKRI